MPIPRPLALTMPAVTVPSSPKGSPRARTQSPTSTLLLSPSRAAGSGPAPLMRSTAKSVFGSVLMSTALNSRPSCRRTMTWPPPATTWLFVKMTPLGSTISPEPAPTMPCPGISGVGSDGNSLKKWRNSGFLNRSPNGVPLKPNGICGELSPAGGFRSLGLPGQGRRVDDHHHRRQHLARRIVERFRQRHGAAQRAVSAPPEQDSKGLPSRHSPAAEPFQSTTA